MSKKPKIHICLYNIDDIACVIDQIEFILSVFRQNSYQISISSNFRDDALNILIEDFPKRHLRTVIDYCKSRNKKVSIIMTEHIDYIDGEIYAYSTPINQINDKHYNPNIKSRLTSILTLSPYIQHIFTLGHYPRLINFHKFAKKRPIVIPYPQIRKTGVNDNIRTNLVFSGKFTDYRTKILKKIREYEFSLIDNSYKDILLNRQKRNSLISSAKINLNIPQDENWQYPSILRILLALSLGKLTLSIENNITESLENKGVDNFYIKIDINNVDKIRHYLDRHDFYYQKCLKEYNSLASKMPFPEDYFKIWGLFENIKFA